MNLQAILLALCLSCSATHAQASEASKPECFATQQQAWIAHPGSHPHYRVTPSGKCWHIGQVTRSGALAAMKPSQPKIGKGTLKVSSAHATPVPYQMHIDETQTDWKYWRFQWTFPRAGP